ncbi:MAG: HAMP domain-containing histidine kinase [Chloroflexi bacterium]|nr:HAMP domain-containing histidine kinase [Chloroflexota bacterium]
MFRSINSRLLLSYLTLITAILGIVTLSLVFFLVRNPRLAREAESNLLLAANALHRQQVATLQNADRATLENAAEQADTLLGVRVALLSPDGTVLVDSRADTEDELPAHEITSRPQGSAQIAEFSDSNEQTWIYTVRTLPKRFTLVIATLRPRAPLLSFFTDELFPPIWRAGLLALLLSLLLAFLMTRWITSPLQRVTAAARNLAKGQMRAIPLDGPSEIQSLAQTFNEMGNKVIASQQSQRDFVANVSHELRTPLTSIQGFAQAILDGTASSGAALKQAAQVVYDEAARMLRLVVDLLDLARLDAGSMPLDMQSIDVKGLLREVIEKTTPLANNAKIDLSLDSEGGIKITGDHDRLTQVFTNIFENAFKHTPAGGRVKILATTERGSAIVIVSDTGPGIPPEEVKRIFERFYQVDKSRKAGAGRGSGLGLSIAKQILKAHHATIHVESQPGAGSRFIIRLPLAQ